MAANFPSDHPLRSTAWVWPELYMYLHNHFAQFRRDFQLTELPEAGAAEAKLCITADKSYRLYVNGRFVCRGPARGYQSHWPVDEVDLSAYLQLGHNWISIEAYNPGISTFCYLHAAKAGLLCVPGPGAGAAGGPLFEAWNASQWMMRRSPGHATQTARLSLQIDFQEHLDLRYDDRSWISDERPPEPGAWNPRMFPESAQNFLSVPFGQPPYDDIEPRGIPLMREELLRPSHVIAAASGPSDAGYQTCQNVSWHWVSESEKIGKWQPGDAVEAALTDDSLELTIEPTGAGRFAAYVIEVGQYVLGNVIVEIEGATGGEIVDFQHDQPVDESHPRYMKIGDGCTVAMANRLHLRAGYNAHEFYQLMGFKHLTLIARDVTEPLTVRVRIRTAGYPFTMGGVFESSDEVLNGIHAICRHTQRICAMDAYVDTPWREQAQWWGDARVQGRNTFYMDGDARLLARGIRSIAGQELKSGLTPGHAPTVGYWCILPDFALTWILTVWDHYWQTGDAGLFIEQQGRVREVLAYFDAPAARHASGLLRYDPRFWLFEDWSTLVKQDVPCFLNLWYALTLGRVADLCDVIGKAEDARRWREMADAHEALIVKYFYDEQAQALRSALTNDLKANGEPSVHDQTLALMLGICPQAHEAMMERYVLPYLADGTLPEGAAKPSAFWCTYVLQEAIGRGYGREAMGFIRRHWEPMLATGTTWENYQWQPRSGWSCAHAWTAHPSYHLPDILAGIRQTGAGWSAVRLEPTFVEGIDRVNCVVPSPRGAISVQWRRDQGRITGRVSVPKEVAVELKLPGQAMREQVGGEVAFEIQNG